MGNRGARSTRPDLFSTPSAREAISLSTTVTARHVLATDLPNAIKQLNDHELDRLVAAGLAEQRRRGRKSEEFPNKRHVETTAISLTSSKVNAVHAAFKAGIKPAQIARQFGLSRTDVLKVLASGRE